MKTKYIPYTVSILALLLMTLMFHKRIHCQSSLPPEKTGTSPKVSPQPPDTFPADGPLFSRLWQNPQYLVLDQVPEFTEPKWFIDPVITDASIYLPVMADPVTVLRYDHRGILQHKIQLDLTTESTFDLQVLPDTGRILAGDNLRQAIRVFDLNGHPLDTLEVGFHFQRVHVSPSMDRYIFYMSHDGSPNTRLTSPPAIRITDDRFQTLFTFFPMSDRAIKAPFYNSTRWKTHPDGIYYNPDYTDQIFDIRFDGYTTLLYDTNTEPPDIEETLDSIVAFAPYQKQPELLARRMPVEHFWVTPDNIIIASMPGTTNQDLVIDRITLRSTLIQGGTLMSQYGDKFNFGYMRPQYVAGAQFVRLFSQKEYNFFMDRLPEDESVRHLPSRLESRQYVLMLYVPDPDVFFPTMDGRQKSEPALSFDLIPNPARDHVKVVWIGEQEEMSIRVFSPDGSIRYDERLKDVRQHYEVEIKTYLWSPGTYIVQVLTKDAVYARTLIVQ